MRNPFLPPIQSSLVHPGNPRAPKYWMNETSGILLRVVEAYLTGKEMSYVDIATMRAYLQQWIWSPVWGGGAALEKLQSDVEVIETRADIERWLEAALQEGIDPL